MNQSEHKTLEYGKNTIEYQLIYADRLNLAIHIYSDLAVVVEAPLESNFADIETYLRKKAAWILRQQQNFRRYPLDISLRRYVSGEKHHFLGQKYCLKVLQGEGDYESVYMDRDQITVITYDTEDHERVKKLLIEWYRKRAYEIFTERVEALVPRFERYGIQRPKVFVRLMHSKWGSCDVKCQMTLSLRLIMVPVRFIDYVIVHELCHLIEQKHSAAFYALMTKIMPDWRERRELLNKFEL